MNGSTSTWLDHIDSLHDDGLAPATKRTQRWIYEWQNPPLDQCDSKKYLLFSNAGAADNAHGLGSLIHVAGYQLMRAVELDRILTWGDRSLGQMFFEDDCLKQGIKTLECMTEPLTHCPRSSIREDNSMDVGVWHDYRTNFTFDSVPEAALAFIREAMPIEWTEMALKYWWRAQSAAYVIRMNQPALEYIARQRMDPSIRHGFGLRGPEQRPIQAPLPYPLQAGTISMHVRHGDKSIEMNLVPFSDYVRGAESLASLNPLAYSRTGYLSSEDPAVFKEAHSIQYLNTKDNRTTPNLDWTFYSASIQRANDGPFGQLQNVKNRTEMTLTWMSELLMTLECDAWVGTRGSNWNRLIDELKCIWVPKCRQPYVEVNTLQSWEGYGW